MEMKRIEAETLEEAYSKAAKELSCSVTEINYEIVQHPTSGVMGLFKKNAIIIAVKKNRSSSEKVNTEEPKIEVKETKTKIEVEEPKIATVNSAITVTQKKKNEEELTDKKVTEDQSTFIKKVTEDLDSVVPKKDEIIDDFFTDKTDKEDQISSSLTEEKIEKSTFDDDRDSPENKVLSLEIEQKIKKLMDVACFEIDTVEVDVFNGIVHIFVDGEDAALLIGKEGYRYNALSYMFFNWINAHYDLYIKLEIAEFIQAQEEMIENYLKPIVEHIETHGKGKTKPLDGILVQIALEKLRAMFPNKYIAIKTGKDGKKFIIINNFNSRKNA